MVTKKWSYYGSPGPSPVFGPAAIPAVGEDLPPGHRHATIGPDEVGVCLPGASTPTGVLWEIGPTMEIMEYLQSRTIEHGWTPDELTWAKETASIIAAREHCLPPVAKLALAIGIPVNQLANFAQRARVMIVDWPKVAR